MHMFFLPSTHFSYNPCIHRLNIKLKLIVVCTSSNGNIQFLFYNDHGNRYVLP